MHLSLDARARTLLRRPPDALALLALEVLLVAVLAAQCARLFWAVVTPVGPIGEWQNTAEVSVLRTADPALFQRFDPFFRIREPGALVVTDLDLRLYGIREDQASGRGSAILATPDGEQNSYAVGDEIMPGVVLHAVEFDSITIERNGGQERLFLDQSPGTTLPESTQARPASRQTVRQASPASAPAQTSVSARELARGTQISPRREGDQLTGIIVQPTGDDGALLAAGFRPGDVIIAIDGERIGDMAQAASFATRLNTGTARVEIERNGEAISFVARVER
jgi:general secretion pathway protein C